MLRLIFQQPQTTVASQMQKLTGALQQALTLFKTTVL